MYVLVTLCRLTKTIRILERRIAVKHRGEPPISI